MDWHPEVYDTIPRSDGSGANDWITRPFDVGYAHLGDAFEVGARRSALVRLRITNYSGSGSNTWLIEPVLVVNPVQPSDLWNVFDAPHVMAGAVAPIHLDSALITFAGVVSEGIYSVPMRLCQYALKITRSGGGSRVLLIEAWQQAA